jgi:hypothetical protein
LDAGLLPWPDINVIKVADPTVAAPFEPVTYTYTVTNPGKVALSNIIVVDDNATPDFASDDFSPSYVGGDTDGDGLLDPNETWTYEATVIPPITLTATGVGGGLDGVEVGTLVVEQLANGDYRFDVIYSEILNDNRYGAGSNENGWPGSGRRFEQIVSSDHVKVTLTDGSGTVVMDMQVDYLSSTVNKYTSVSQLFPGGISGSGGQNDGVLLVGDPAWFMDPSTSLYENFLNGFTEATYPNILTDYVGENVAGYEYRMIYSFTIDDAAFGVDGFGGVEITGMHNSPAKDGFPDGDVATEIIPQTVTNSVQATGVFASAHVSSTDTATVNLVIGGQTAGTLSSTGSGSSQVFASSLDSDESETLVLSIASTSTTDDASLVQPLSETDSSKEKKERKAKKDGSAASDAYFRQLDGESLRVDLSHLADSIAS